MTESTGDAPTVLLVEDEQSIADPFAQALARNGFRPLIARTASEGLRLGRESKPDVVLLDLSLPDGDGRDVCRELRRISDVPIIMLTARGTVTDRVVGLELGADDYVVKPFAVGEVISRIRAVLRRTRGRGSLSGGRTADGAEPTGAAGGSREEPRELQILDLRVDAGARRAWLDQVELELTRKEFDLLERLARDAGRVVSRETLMSEVWDENWFGSTKTLDVHIAGLRRKLGDSPSHLRYIQTVRGVGFRFAAAEGDGTRAPSAGDDRERAPSARGDGERAP